MINNSLLGCKGVGCLRNKLFDKYLMKSTILPRNISSSSLNHINSSSFGLNEEQLLLQNMGRDFANNELYPNASNWDEKKIFPEDALRKAAKLGLGGMFVKDDIGGTGLSRLDGTIILEELASGCTGTTAYLSIHNSRFK